ncbi:hypothetical protein F4779DRAFT_621284 [Xylariaceae sp. FL0662B]|nr:hypothetical protein F4779DRAFT_621284 [Xylariaceae sp. FL0662B]
MEFTRSENVEDIRNEKAVADLGLRPIHLACLEGRYEDVLELADEDINARSQPDSNIIQEKGDEWRWRETPIMLAALMGHLDIVQFLVERGVELGTRHNQTRHNQDHAYIYAQEDGFAATRRDFFRKINVGREHYDALNTRKAIYHLLLSPARRRGLQALRGPRADLGYLDYKLAKKGKKVIVYGPVLEIDTDVSMDPNKTVGILMSRRDDKVLKVAYSGWSSGNLRDDLCLDVNKWNYNALHKIAARLNFKFPASGHDNQYKPTDVHRGRAHAGHVEILLACWYAVEMTRLCYSESNPDDDWLIAHLSTLRRSASILKNRRDVIIYIDSQPCSTCITFINRLQQYTGLWIFVQGGTGIGPTLATKSKRTNIRYDTFGDVFFDSENEGEGLAEASITESLTTRPLIQDVSMEDRSTPAAQNETFAWDISQSFVDVAQNHLSPIQDDSDLEDTSNGDDDMIGDHNLIGRITRPAMAWPPPDGPGPDGLQNSPSNLHKTISWKPDNHLQLLTEYKKKTPVYDWPGYPPVPIPRVRSHPAQIMTPPSATNKNTDIGNGTKLIIEINDDNGREEDSEYDYLSTPSESNFQTMPAFTEERFAPLSGVDSMSDGEETDLQPPPRVHQIADQGHGMGARMQDNGCRQEGLYSSYTANIPRRLLSLQSDENEDKDIYSMSSIAPGGSRVEENRQSGNPIGNEHYPCTPIRTKPRIQTRYHHLNIRMPDTYDHEKEKEEEVAAQYSQASSSLSSPTVDTPDWSERSSDDSMADEEEYEEKEEPYKQLHLPSSGSARLQQWRYEAPRSKEEEEMPKANESRERQPLRKLPALHRWRHSPLVRENPTRTEIHQQQHQQQHQHYHHQAVRESGARYPFLNSRLIL